MSPRRRTPRVRAVQADAKQLFAALADHSIDVLITDPPYRSVNRRATGGHLRDWFRGGLSWPQIGRLLAIARRKLKPSGLLFVMSNGDGLASASSALQQAGFVGIRTITWDRRWPGLGDGLRHRTEFILLGRLPGSRAVHGSDLIAVSAVGPGTAERYPTQKPVGLGRAIARIANVGSSDLVVDPFCGSGALLVGSAERGASVVGGDIAGHAVRLATVRLGSVAAGSRRAAGGNAPAPPASQRAPTAHPPVSLVRRRKATAPAPAPPASKRPGAPAKQARHASTQPSSGLHRRPKAGSSRRSAGSTPTRPAPSARRHSGGSR
jgi:site-specific DNA-methyltransferase (adenine-specific)